MIIKSEILKNTKWNFEYGELKTDADFVGKCENLAVELVQLQEQLNKLLPLKARYEELPPDEKIDLDLMLVYTLNALFWIDLRIQGIDVTKHPIKRELDRIKAVMLRWKQVKDRDKRPKVNIDAAKRFVRSGLYDHKDAQNNSNESPNTPSSSGPPNKKIRFD